MMKIARFTQYGKTRLVALTAAALAAALLTPAGLAGATPPPPRPPPPGPAGRHGHLPRAERLPLLPGQWPAGQPVPGAGRHPAAGLQPHLYPEVRRPGLEDHPVLGGVRLGRPRHPARRTAVHGPAGALPRHHHPWRPAPVADR